MKSNSIKWREGAYTGVRERDTGGTAGIDLFLTSEESEVQLSSVIGPSYHGWEVMRLGHKLRLGVSRCYPAPPCCLLIAVAPCVYSKLIPLFLLPYL